MLPMDTPTSQARVNQPSHSLARCLSEIAAGTFTYGQLAAFSNLSRAALRQVESAWPSIDQAMRCRLIAEAVELAEENVQYDFSRLCRFALADPEADVRQLALSGLWEDESESLLEEMLEIARYDDSTDVRAAAVALIGAALARLRDSESNSEYVVQIAELVLSYAVDPLQPALLRRRAIEAVGSLEQTDHTRSVIHEVFEHGDQTLEAGALAAMGRSLESRWRPTVRWALASEDPEIRFESARALGFIGTSDDVGDLSELTLDEDSEVRQAAIFTLGEIGGPGAIRILRNLADQVSESERDAINEALDTALLGNDPLRAPI
jgi:HEAT repeat protein